jgi:Anti-sigma-28 factor, FlgM
MNGLANAVNPGKVSEIKRQLESGQYRIDPYAIADAMIRWAELELESAGRRVPRARSQNECSKPEGSLGASVKTAPGGPARTAPIRLRAAIVLGHAA